LFVVQLFVALSIMKDGSGEERESRENELTSGCRG